MSAGIVVGLLAIGWLAGVVGTLAAIVLLGERHIAGTYNGRPAGHADPTPMWSVTTTYSDDDDPDDDPDGGESAPQPDESEPRVLDIRRGAA